MTTITFGRYSIHSRKVVGPDSHGDYIKGTRGDDELHGGAGRDYVEGKQGNDLITGDGGGDKLYHPLRQGALLKARRKSPRSAASLCAQHVQSLGGESPLADLMEVKA